MNKIRIAAVSYLNTKPFLYGLNNNAVINDIDIKCYSPAICAQKLMHNEADIGLIPVVEISSIKHAETIADYCIGSIGKVDSVTLFSQAPVGEITKLMLDYQSRTSVLLAQVLFKNLWHSSPLYVNTEPGFENKIKGTTAAVIIGDRAMAMKGKHNYETDLSQAWFELTGLPFVFACWVSNKKIPQLFIDSFNKALHYGISHIDTMLKGENLSSDEYSQNYNYLINSISYPFDENKKKGLAKFIKLLQELR